MVGPMFLRDMSLYATDENKIPFGSIGLRAYGKDGRQREFLWWNNLKRGNVNRILKCYDKDPLLARGLRDIPEIEKMVVGHAVDLERTDPLRKMVSIYRGVDIQGIYIELIKGRGVASEFLMNRIRNNNNLREKL